MPLAVKHTLQTAIADDPSFDVSSSEWNADHSMTGALAIANGGTNATTAPDALTNLGAVAKAGDTMTGPLAIGVADGTAGVGFNYGDGVNCNFFIYNDGGYMENGFESWGTFGSVLSSYAARGTRSAPAAVQAGDYLNTILYYAKDLSGMFPNASIAAVCDAAPTVDGTPTAIGFWTGANKGGGVERLRIASSGKINLPNPVAITDADQVPTKAYVDATDTALTTTVNGKVAKVGDTMTGDLIIANPATTSALIIDKPVGTFNSDIWFKTGGVNRWLIRSNSQPEGGSNAGSDLNIIARSDAGAVLHTALTITRATGLITVSSDPTSALGITTKQYADTKVAKAGDTMTGNLTIDKANPTITLDKSAGNEAANITATVNGLNRWVFQLGNEAGESGGNAGSSLTAVRFSDAGAYLGTSLAISRVDGRVTLEGDPTATLHAATKNYVDTTTVSLAGDTMTGALTVTPKGSLFGIAGGTAAAGTLVPADANVKLYDFGSGNWSGVGVDNNGFFWIRTGLAAGAPTAFTIDSSQFAFVAKDPTAALGVATKQYVDTGHNATAAEYLSNSAPTKKLNSGAVWTAASYTTLTDGATVTPDFNSGIDFVWTLGAAGRTMANPTNATKIGQKGIIWLIQDGTGNRTITTWGGNWKFLSGTKPTLTSAANSYDAISYTVLGSSFIACVFMADFK